MYKLILVNFLNFCQSVKFNSIKFKGEKKERNLHIPNVKLFNMYVSEVKEDLLNFNLLYPNSLIKKNFELTLN